jgi:hypothetical protein
VLNKDKDTKERKKTLMGKFGFSDDEENDPVVEIPEFGRKAASQEDH